MVTANKTNPEIKAYLAKVAPADMLRRVIQYGKAARTAALDLCYACTAYILLVNHFTDPKDKGFLSRQDAVDFLRKQVKDHAGVEGGMLDIYIRNASRVAGMILGSPKLFADVINRLSTAATPDDMIPILSGWMDKNANDKGTRRKVDSLSALSEELGYSTGRPTAGASGVMTAAKAPERIANVVKAVEKIVEDGDKKGNKITAKAAMQAIAVAVPQNQSFILAREAITRILEDSELDVLEQCIKQQRVKAKELAKKAKANVAETAGKSNKPLPVDRKGRNTTRRVSV